MRWKFKIVIMASCENALAIKTLMLYKQREQPDVRMHDKTQSCIVALNLKYNKAKYSWIIFNIA